MKRYYNKNQHTQSGFTLVELAIVLVIIGLIVASVLAGQDLIKSAELRATTKQYQEFQAAVNTFIGKFGGIPGDIVGDNATYGLTGGDSGDGDGTLEDVSADNTYDTFDGELSDFWSDLTSSTTGYIPGSYDGDEGAASATVNDVVGENMPQMKFGAHGWGVYGASAVNYFVTGVVGGSATDSYDTANDFVPVDAYSIDSKIDDGTATTGNVTTRDAATAAPDTVGDTTNCNSAAGVYVFSKTTAECGLAFKMTTF